MLRPVGHWSTQPITVTLSPETRYATVSALAAESNRLLGALSQAESQLRLLSNFRATNKSTAAILKSHQQGVDQIRATHKLVVDLLNQLKGE